MWIIVLVEMWGNARDSHCSSIQGTIHLSGVLTIRHVQPNPDNRVKDRTSAIAWPPLSYQRFATMHLKILGYCTKSLGFGDSAS